MWLPWSRTTTFVGRLPGQARGPAPTRIGRGKGTWMAEIDLAGLDACVEQQLKRWTVPGAVVGIWREGEATLRAYGVANLDVGWPTRADMRFRIASISKVFTATL